MKFACMIILFFFINIEQNQVLCQALNIEKINWKGKKVRVSSDFIVVKLKENVNKTIFENIILKRGLSIEKDFDQNNFAVINIKNRKVAINDLINKLLKLELFEVVEPSFVGTGSLVPNDTYYSNQYALPKVNADDAWNITKGSSNVKIAILDSGIPTLYSYNSLSHEDLSNSSRIIPAIDFVNDGNGVKDENGHGTHVAGIVGAETHNGKGIAGINWYSKLRIYQVFDYRCEGLDIYFHNAVYDAVTNGCKIINFSGGFTNGSAYLENAVQHTHNNGVLLVVSAGNYDPVYNPNKVVLYPAAYSNNYNNVISVSATTSNDIIADFSSRGPEIVFSAPGDGIYSTIPNYSVYRFPNWYSGYNYEYMSGTSMAAPLVSGFAGLLWAKYPWMNFNEIIDQMKRTAKDLGTTGRDNLYGFGRIDIGKALENIYVPEMVSTITSAVSQASPSQTIVLAPSTTYTDTISYSGKDYLKIAGASNGTSVIDGNITLTNCTDFDLSNLKMHNGHSITINSSSGSDTHFITFMGSGSINQYNGNGNHTSGVVHNAASTSAALYYYNTSGNVWGVDITDHDFGIWATANASMNVSTSTFCDNMLDLYANSGGYIYAPNNTMSAPWPQSIGGNVSGYSSYVCSKQLSKSDLLVEGIEDNPLPEEINFLNAEYAELLKRITDENEDKSPSVLIGYKPEFDALIKDYKALLTGNSSPVETTAILSKIEKCYYATESQNEFEAYIKTLLLAKSSPYIERYFVNLNLNKGKYKEAIEVCEKVLSSKGINEALTCEMLYEEALIYKYSLSNTTKANELFTKLVNDYPDNGLFSFAARELEQEGLEAPKAENSNTNQEEAIAKGFSVESYPNPFNPSTTISYTLPSEADVKIAIYDIMGRKVKTLASESKPIGSYQVTWDGTNSNGLRVTSGIYLYRFEAVSLETNKHFTKSAKLLLVK